MLIFLFATHNSNRSTCFVVVFADAVPFVSDSLVDVTFVDIQHETLRDFLISISDEGRHLEALLVHADSQSIKGYFFVLLLSFLYLLEDVSHVELHASDKRYLQHKGTHEVVKDIAALFLEVNCLVLLEIVEDLVVSHCQLHHTIDLTLQFFLISLFEILEIVELLSKTLHFLLLQ